MHPGLRLRQARERLGLTYREVERASYELAAPRGRSEFILHISRLAEIENRGVVPGLHKLYSLAAIYHLNPQDILRWYEIRRGWTRGQISARDRNGHALKRAGEYSSRRISSRARRFEQKRSLR
jgi:transcriptional regulator with XRE-family HTH domain